MVHAGRRHYLRADPHHSHGTSDAGIWLSVLAVLMLAVSGWLGGKLVYVHGVAVDPSPAAAETGEHRYTAR